ncbi:MAG: amino acid ABC transporter permease [Gammaproteobacteria bacterium]|nr:amino acid ABC transporter permease [Gammaproteobacteria bacterium]
MPSDDLTQSPRSKVPLWRQPVFRGLMFQVLLVLGIVAFGYYLFSNTLQNMEQRGITTGFGFLSNEAGFGILQSLIPYDETYSYGRTFFVGLLNTLLVAVLGIFFATFIGFFMGVARLSGNWLVARLATIYIEVFRNIPLLLQIMFWYFAVLRPLPRPRQSLEFGDAVFLNNRGLFLPKPVAEDGFGVVAAAIVIVIVGVFLLARWARRRQETTGRQFPVGWVGLGVIVGVPLAVFWAAGSPMHFDYPALKGFNFKGGLEVIPELAALVLALSIYTGAFIAEAVRSGIQAVSHGQTEAASALGLRPKLTLKLVIIPQAMRVIIPQLTSQYLNLTKNSSLATAIGYPDLVSVFAGTTLNQTGQAVEVIAMTMAVYLAISLSISMFMNWYNRRIQLVQR